MTQRSVSFRLQVYKTWMTKDYLANTEKKRDMLVAGTYSSINPALSSFLRRILVIPSIVCTFFLPLHYIFNHLLDSFTGFESYQFG